MRIKKANKKTVLKDAESREDAYWTKAVQTRDKNFVLKEALSHKKVFGKQERSAAPFEDYLKKRKSEISPTINEIIAELHDKKLLKAVAEGRLAIRNGVKGIILKAGMKKKKRENVPMKKVNEKALKSHLE